MKNPKIQKPLIFPQIFVQPNIAIKHYQEPFSCFTFPNLQIDLSTNKHTKTITVTTVATKYVGVSARDLPCLNKSAISHTKNNNNKAHELSMQLYKSTLQRKMEYFSKNMETQVRKVSESESEISRKWGSLNLQK